MWITDNPLTRFFRRAIGSAPRVSDDDLQTDHDLRVQEYMVRELIYNNGIFRPKTQGGRLEDVLKDELGIDTGVIPANRLIGYYNPVRSIVDFYQNVIPGTFGEGMKVAPEYKGKPVNTKLLDPIDVIWAASNLDTEKQRLQRFAANLGTVGIRTTYRADEKNPNNQRVRLMVDHPGRIENFFEDDFGNVSAVKLKYRILQSDDLDDDNPDTIEVVERLDKEEFSREYDGKEQLDDAQRKNPLGFCPYVLLRHRKNNESFGEHAYSGLEPVVYGINLTSNAQSRSARRAIHPQWVISTSGTKPRSLEFGEDKVIWAEQTVENTRPLIQAIVPTIDHAGVLAYTIDKYELVRQNFPEITFTDFKLLSGISGESLAQTKLAAESKIYDVRSGYWDSVRKALKMAVSAGVAISKWDVGAGTGTPEAVEQSYREFEGFDFEPRSGLPQTALEKISQATANEAAKSAKFATAKAAQGIGVDEETTWELAGFTQDQIKEMKRRKTTADVVPTTGL